MALKTSKRKTSKPSDEKRRRDDDAFMKAVAEEVLRDPNLSIESTVFTDMMRRFVELLAKEQARRPAHRPSPVVSTGRKVAIWVEARSRTHGLAEAEKWAIARVASSQKLKPSTVGRRYRAYRQQQKQRGGK